MSPPASPQPHHDSTWWACPLPHLAGALTPPAVQDAIQHQQRPSAQLQTQMAQFQSPSAQLQPHGETRQGRVAQTAHTSRKPPSSAAPFHKPTHQRQTSTGTRGGQQGHRGNGATVLRPTAGHLREPGPWPCGHGTVLALSPSHPHPVREWPPSEMAIHHVVLPQGHCQGGGRQRKAQGPSPYQAAYGPRWRALSGALAGPQRPSWRLVQDCWHSVCTLPLSRGAVQHVIHRVSQALVPPSEAMATLAHQAPVGSMDDTPG